jgi:pimeloyl-ACP methyl ester carboxylesterase
MRKTLNINGIELSYLEKNENSNEIVFFIHGNSCSSRMWQKQFESELLLKYRLIAIDLPGHGLSSTSKNPFEDYSPIGTAKILSKAIREISHGNPSLLVGFSYGSNLTAEVTKFDLNPVGIVLLGSCVLGEGYGLDKIFVQNNTPSIFLYNEANESIVSDFLNKAISHGNEEDIRNSIEDYLIVSTDFKPALFKTVAEGKISDEIKILQQLNISVCVIFGMEDNLININYLDDTPFPIWRNTIYKFSGAGHWVNIENADKFNQILSEYLTDMFTVNHA